MIIQPNHGYESISNHDELREYYGLQENINLRHARATSLNSFESVRIFIPHKVEKYSLLIPYNTNQSSASNTTESLQNKGQTVEAMTRYGMLKETGLRATTMTLLGLPILPELAIEGQPKKISIVIVEEYYKRLEYEILYYNSSNDGPPVWVQMDLLSEIFEDIKTDEDRYQHEVYRRAKVWFSQRS